MGVQDRCAVSGMARTRVSESLLGVDDRAETRRELSERMLYRTEKCLRGGCALILPRMKQVVELGHDGLVAEMGRHVRRQRQDGEPEAVEGDIGEVACGEAHE